jgi:hypothetical protein
MSDFFAKEPLRGEFLFQPYVAKLSPQFIELTLAAIRGPIGSRQRTVPPDMLIEERLREQGIDVTREIPESY